VPAEQVGGWSSVEQITPYPPGIPALLPAERISAGVLDCLRSEVAAGMVLPDAAVPRSCRR
jgi:arginine decarboxylase